MCEDNPNPGGEAASKISENLCPSVAKPGWGGRRPGAGAPRGNLNALKHGRRSRQFAEIGAIIAGSDSARNALLALAHRRQRKGKKADAAAADLLVQLFNHAKDIAAGRDSRGPFRYVLGLNDADQRLNSALTSLREADLN